MQKNIRKNWLARSIFVLLCCAEGATAIEYAIVMPVLLLLLMGIVEYSLVMYASSVLDGATETAARAGRTGYDGGGNRDGYIRGVLNSRVTGLFSTDPSKLVLTAQSYKTFADVKQPEPCLVPAPCPGQPGVDFIDSNHNGTWDAGSGTPGFGNSNEIVSYSVTYPWTISTPIVSSLIGKNGKYVLSSTVLVKNEPFKNASGDGTVSPYATLPALPPAGHYVPPTGSGTGPGNGSSGPPGPLG